MAAIISYKTKAEALVTLTENLEHLIVSGLLVGGTASAVAAHDHSHRCVSSKVRAALLRTKFKFTKIFQLLQFGF